MPISAPKIPEGLPELMRGLAKSVIKENPENLYVHAAEYFENLIRERDGELERGYQTFNAYQVYADYKEKGREKLGLAKVDGSSISDGEEGDESGSGGSGTKSRGRRRARRARKQSSREKSDPPTAMVEKPPSRDTEGEPQKLNSLVEESAPVPVVEQEVVKVHYNPPEAPPSARVVSAQSVEAEQAVSSVLDDEQILDSDGTGGSKDTGDELVDPVDDVGTAPSTAEITEPRPPVEENGAMALQDMETCFMHANVDDLLEKHPEEQTAANDDSKTATADEILDVPEGEDIPEGPQMKEEPSETLNAPETATQETTEMERKTDAKQIIGDGEKSENVTENVIPLAEDTSPTATEANETGDVAEKAEEIAAENKVENVGRPKSSGTEAVTLSDIVDATKPVEDVQEPEEVVEEIVQKVTIDRNETVASDVAAIVESEDKADLPSKEVRNKTSREEEPPVSSPLGDKPDETITAASVIETGDSHTEPITVADGNGSKPQQIVESVTVASRMGLDEAETGDDADRVEEPRSDSGDDNAGKEDEKIDVQVDEKARENSSKSNEEDTSQSPNDEQQNGEEVKEAIVESKTELNEQSIPRDNNLKSEDSQQQESDEIKEGGESLAKHDDQALQKNVAYHETIENKSKETVDDEKDINQVQEVPSSPVVTPVNEVEPVEETVEAVEQDELQSATPPQENQDIVPGSSGTEVDETKSSDSKSSEDPPPTDTSLEKEDTQEADGPRVADGHDAEEQKIEDATVQDSEKDSPESTEAKDENEKPTKDEKIDQSLEPTENQEAVEDEPVKDQSGAKEPGSPSESQASQDLVREDESVQKSTEKVDSVDSNVELDSKENTIEEEEAKEPQLIEHAGPETSEVKVETVVNDSQDKANESGESVDATLEQAQLDDNVDAKQDPTETQTLEAVAMETLPQLLNSGGTEEVVNVEKDDGEYVDKKSATSSQESTDKEKDVEGEVKDADEGNLMDNDEPSSVETAPQLQADVIERSPQLTDEPNPDPTSPVVENVESGTNKSDKSAGAPVEQLELESGDKQEPSLEEVNEDPCVKREKREAILEEVIEEPCVKREVTPTKSIRPDVDDTGDKQVEELEEIKKVDLSQLSKDSAEALFYSLKKSELENQEPVAGSAAPPAGGPGSQESNVDDDDKDVVVAEEPPQEPPSDANTKRTFTDDFLDEAPITETQTATASSDGVQQDAVSEPAAVRSASEAAEQDDEFNPMVMVSMRSKQFQEQLHSRAVDEEPGDEQAEKGPTPARPLMRRCMTEVTGLQRYNTTVEEDPADSRAFDPAFVEEEDQFDGYYIGHIKNKILASSVSVADSDYFDPAQSSEEPVDENNVRTALETIASTDTESTIASQATIQQAGKRSYLRKHSQNTSTNIPYASFGNAAIDKSLDEFIEREEQNKQDEAMAEAATKIQRSYRTHKKRLLRDYHSTMRTFTEDQSAESGGEEYAANVIQIKLDQKRADDEPPTAGGGDGDGVESDSATGGSLHPHQPLGTGKRPMYSLNIDEYDTVARRMTLTRGVALQRNSTPEDDSGKSANASTETRKPSLNSAPTPESASASSPSSGEGQMAQPRSLSSEEKSDPANDEEPSAARISSSAEQQEPKESHSSSRARPHRTAPAATAGRELEHGPAPRGAGRTNIAQLDVQSLLLIARQRTMPVQIDSSVIRVLPKHMRKRISSAGMLNGGGKRK